MKVCRICLSQDGRLYPFSSNSLGILYRQLSLSVIPHNIHEKVDKMLPPWVCADCGLRLLSYDKLRQKSLRAHQLLCDMLSRCQFKAIDEDVLKQIDREKSYLQSNYTQHTVNIDYYITDKELINIKTEDSEQKQENNTKIEEFVIKIELDDTLTSEKEKTSHNNDDYNSESELSNNLKDSDVSDENTNSDNASESSELSDASLYDLASYTNLELLGDMSDSSLSDIMTQEPENKKQRQEIKKKVDAFMKELKRKPAKRVRKKVPKKKVVSIDPYPFEEMFTVQKFSLDEQKELIEKRKYSENYIHSPLKCADCYKGFTCNVTFERHRLKHTDKWGKLECKICKHRFPSTKSIRSHMSLHNILYSCKLCMYTTPYRFAAITHGLRHKGKSYQCPHCGLQFASRSSYFGHIRVKHVSKVACEYCGFSFINSKGLQQHKNLKHRAETDITLVPTDGPTCASCDIKFVSDEALNTHVRISHPRTPNEKLTNEYIAKRLRPVSRKQGRFPCSVCGKVFVNASNRARHMVTHSGVRPFICEICGSNFKSKRELKLHTTHVHLKVPWPKRHNK